MESSSQFSSETQQSHIQVASCSSGYSTPPRSNTTCGQSSTNSSFSQLFHQQPKLLTSAELKRRFSPIYFSNKKRRQHLIRKNDCIVPSERNLNMPVISKKLFDDKEESFMKYDDCIVPYSCSMSSLIHPRPNFDYLICKSLKTEQENTFFISETIMKQKLKILFQKK